MTLIKIVDKNIFTNNAFVVAHFLMGKLLVRNINGKVKKYRINEVEVYYGEEDTACHARFGKTSRTLPLYEEGGTTYIYLCYGIHHLINIVTGPKDHPEAVLIRGVEGYEGPGKLTKELIIDKLLLGINITNNDELWLEDDGYIAFYECTPRIGIDYATDLYKMVKWRYVR